MSEATAPTKQEPAPVRYGGVIRWYDEKMGYGFIAPDRSTPNEGKRADIFFHGSELPEDHEVILPDTHRVSFERSFDARMRACAVAIRFDDNHDSEA